MAIIDSLLPEFDREMGSTRRLLERVPIEHGAWTPHPKSRTLLDLATHVAIIPGHVVRAMTLTEWDRSAPRPDLPPITTNADLLALFDGHVRDGRATLVDKTDGELMVAWTFKHAGKEVFTQPRLGILRNMCLNHLIHHRGQLTVYLRLKDVPLPPIYGPTADEAF